MIKITVDKNGVDKLLTVLADGAASIKDWSKPFKQFGVLLRAEQKQNFDQQGRIYGGDIRGILASVSMITGRGVAMSLSTSGSWAKLAPSTRKDRKRQGYNAARPILVRSGELKGAFTTKITPTSLVTENTSEYAKYHQNGTKFMPSRKIIGMSKKGIEALGLAMEKHIAGAFKMEAHKAGMVIIK